MLFAAKDNIQVGGCAGFEGLEFTFGMDYRFIHCRRPGLLVAGVEKEKVGRKDANTVCKRY